MGQFCDEPQERAPRVSVGLPVYNGEAFIASAIESILDQSFENLELVISDNASTDGTESICRRFAAQDPRVQYVRSRQNYGYVSNWNTAFQLSRGAYFKWAAADDVCAPDFIGRCVEVLDRDPSAVLAFPRTRGIDEGGQLATLEYVPGPGQPAIDISVYSNVAEVPSAASSDPVERFDRHMQDLWETTHLYGLIRSAVLSKTRLHPHHYMGDHILLAELCLHGRFVEIPETMFFRRTHSAQVLEGVRSARQRLALASPDPEQPVPWWGPALAYPRRLSLHLAGIRRAPLRPSQRRSCYRLLAQASNYWASVRLPPIISASVGPPHNRRLSGLLNPSGKSGGSCL
jgi:hypothetical protein